MSPGWGHRRGLAARRRLVGALVAASVIACGAGASAQSIEPRAYAPAPTGVNFLIIGLVGTQGGLSLDSAIHLTNARLGTLGPVLAYARSFDLFGRSAKVDVIAPFGRLSGSATYEGQPLGRKVDGWGDPQARLSVNLYGAPALNAAQFRTYAPGLIVGASVQVTAPLGQYDDARVLNISAHRWAVKPEIGVSQTFGPWSVEWDNAVTVFTENDDFYGGHRRSQDPLFASQAHVVYSFRSGIWGAFDATYFTGGRSTLDGTLKNDLQRNWRVGLTLALPVSRRNSVKLSASEGVSARTGNNYDAVGVAWQYRWGGGL
jgi:hypothetical protein